MFRNSVKNNKMLVTAIMLFVMAIIFVSLTSCMDSVVHIVITVDSPVDGSTVNTPQVTVSGSLSKKASLKINDMVLPDSNKFNVTVPLTDGINSINIAATSKKPAETVTKSVIVTYVPDK
jgi:hypothetical protein